jgi:hypothetical protein
MHFLLAIMLCAVYRGSNLVHEKISGTFSVHNDRPDDTAQALEYFSTYTDEVLQLDDLYMSHSKITGAVPNSVSNTVHGKGGGRTSLVLDQELLKHCALKTDLTDVNALGLRLSGGGIIAFRIYAVRDRQS